MYERKVFKSHVLGNWKCIEEMTEVASSSSGWEKTRDLILFSFIYTLMKQVLDQTSIQTFRRAVLGIYKTTPQGRMRHKAKIPRSIHSFEFLSTRRQGGQ